MPPYRIAAPIARGTRSVIGSISGIDDTVGAYVSAGTQNRRLRKQLADPYAICPPGGAMVVARATGRRRGHTGPRC